MIKKIKILIQFVSFTWIWKKLTHCQSKDSLNSFFYFIIKTDLQWDESTASHGFNQAASLDFNKQHHLTSIKRSFGFHMHFLFQIFHDLQWIVWIDSSSSHWKLTFSRHDIAEKLVLNKNHSLTHWNRFI